jgi:hypothetical protein
MFFGRDLPRMEVQEVLPYSPLYMEYLLREFRGSILFKKSGRNFPEKSKILSLELFIIKRNI